MIEILAVVFTLISVYYTIKANVLGWYIGILGIICYSVIFIDSKLYASSFLQLVFLFQSFYGIYKWKQNIELFDKLMIRKYPSPEQLYKLAIGFFLSYHISYIILSNFLSSNLLEIDILATLGSILSLHLMAKRYYYSWYSWMIVNLLYIIIFTINGLYLSIILYFVLILMNIIGLTQWKKEYETQINSQNFTQ